MKTYVHLWQYLAEYFLEWEMFQTKVVEKTKTHILCPVTFPRKSYRLWDNVVKISHSRAQATDDNIIWRMRIACWITTARDTNSEYVIIYALPPPNRYANAYHCYVICTLSFFFSFLNFGFKLNLIDMSYFSCNAWFCFFFIVFFFLVLSL